VALQLLRAIEEMLNKGGTHNLIVRTRSEVALYVLNHKRGHLRALEERFRITITISADATVNAQVSYIVDRGEQVHTVEAAKALALAAPQMVSVLEADEDILDAAAESEADEEDLEGEAEADSETEAEEVDGEHEASHVETIGEAPRLDSERPSERNGGRDGEREGGRRRRRRGRGRGRGGEPREGGQRPPRDGAPQFTNETVAEHAIAHEDHDGGSPEEFGQAPRAEGAPVNGNGEGADTPEGRRRRRRGRRGGRRNRNRNGEGPAPFNPNEAAPDANLESAVADLDKPPASFDSAQEMPHETPRAYSPPPYQPPAAPAPVEAPVASSPSQEPPRRRSTIREPAPIGAAAASPPPSIPKPEPVVSSTAEPAAPKRGWWGKRLLGDN
jgi:ribonuclease E